MKLFIDIKDAKASLKEIETIEMFCNKLKRDIYRTNTVRKIDLKAVEIGVEEIRNINK